MKLIPLTQGKIAMVDDEDFEKFGKFKWQASFNNRAKSFTARRNAYVNGNRKTLLLHRVILGITDPKIKVDHINHNTLDDQCGNLRACSHAQNMKNRNGAHFNSLSGIRGVYWHKASNSWVSRIHVDGKAKHLGCFARKSDAAAAYAAANKLYFGEFGGKL